jgi:hypothetical protein
MQSFKEYFNENYTLVLESKQEIINLGYPKIIADVFFEKFGRNSFLIAKWFKDSKKHSFHKGNDADWFIISQRQLGRGQDMADLINLYLAAEKESPEDYKKVLKYIGITPDDEIDESYLYNQKIELAEQIREDFTKDYFFRSKIINDIHTGVLKDLTPYKKLSFGDAQNKYDEKLIFKDKKPLKVYPDGYKWIDVGNKCQLIGSLMKNCGSAGMMGLDQDRTILTLFDPDNKPHVMTVWHPNEKRLSGDESAGSQPVKEKYHDYVLDLADFLGATFDTGHSKSKLLSIKYTLRGKLREIEPIGEKSPYNEYYRLTMDDGKIYYTDCHYLISKSNVSNLRDYPFKKTYGYIKPKTYDDLAEMVLSQRYNITQDRETAIATKSMFIPIFEFGK